MKLKRFTALVVSLAMVLSIVPAFSLTASAAADYTTDQLVSLAKGGGYVFDGSKDTAGNVATSTGATTDMNLNVISSPAAWTGWTSTYTGTGSDHGSTLCINMINGSSYNYIQFYGAKDKSNSFTVSPAVQIGTAGKDYLIIEWTGGYGNGASEHDIKLTDNDGNDFDTFRYLIENGAGIGPVWADNRYASELDSNQKWTSFDRDYSVSDGSKYPSTRANTYYRLIYKKLYNDAGTAVTGYTATYASGDGSTWKEAFTKTYTGYDFNGLKTVNIAVAATKYTYSGQRFGDLKIYAGNYPAASKTITATYTVNGNKVGEKSVITESDSASFDAYYYSVNGENVLYKADATTLTEDATIAMTPVENADVAELSNSATFNWRGDTGIIKSGNLIPNGDFSNGIAGWYNAAGSAMSAVNVNSDGTVTTTGNGGSSSEFTLQRSWAIEDGKTYVFTYYNSQTSALDLKWQRFCLGNDFANNNNAMIIGAGSGDVETGFAAATGQNTVVFTNTEGYKYANFRAAYSGGVTFDNFGLYEVEGLTESYSITITGAGENNKNYSVTALSVEDIDIPYFEGYVFAERTVDDTSVTYTYEKTDKKNPGSWAIRNNVTGGTWVTQMKFLGAHNAFANKGTAKVNEGGALYAENGGDAPGASSTDSVTVNGSRAQTKTVLEMLNLGVRYFDIRLTRQSDGTFWTVHGPAFSEFRPIAETIAQWAEENPGEIILLDFHTTYDALYDNETYNVVDNNTDFFGKTPGDDNLYVYSALNALLVETGVMSYRPSNWDKNYDVLTNNGTRTSILPIAKYRFYQCIRGTGNAMLYIDRSSNTSGDKTYEDSRYYDDYSIWGTTITTGVTTKIDKNYSNLSSGASIGLIHAYVTDTALGLLYAADKYNDSWKNENLAGWMGRNNGDVLLMNGIDEDVAETYLSILSQYNRDGYDDYYGNETDTDMSGCTTISSNGVVMTGLRANVPDYSTEFRATPTEVTDTYNVGAKTYTAKTKYNVQLLQYDEDSKNITGKMTLTFPNPATSDLEIAALLSANGETVLSTAKSGETLSADVTSLGEYIVATVPTNGIYVTVKYDADGTIVRTEEKYVAYNTLVYTVPAGEFYITKEDGTKAYIVSSASDKTYTVTENDGEVDSSITLTVELDMVHENAVLEDALVTGVDDTIWGANSADEKNQVLVCANGNQPTLRGPHVDADGVRVDSGVNAGDLGASRAGLMQFPVVDLGENEAAIAVFPVVDWHDYTWSGGNTSIRLAAYAMNTSEWTTYDDDTKYYPAEKNLLENPVFSTVNTDATSEVRIDVTEFMKAAKAEGMTTLSVRLACYWGGVYLAQSEYAVAGGKQPGKAAYIDIVDAKTVSVAGATKVTKNGSDVTAYATDAIVVPADETIKIYTSNPYVTDDTNVYAVENGVVDIQVTDKAEYRAAKLGIGMVAGAQVRIGGGVDGDGRVSAGSGLRFITTVDGADSLAAIEGATFGVEITAEGSSNVVDIPAEKWQGETVFTSALTDLAVSNYNRRFTATPYVKIGDTKYYGEPITRSIYQVAAGLLANNGYKEPEGGWNDTTDTNYDEMSEVLINVLNAYVNQVGVRLSFTDKGGLAEYTKENGAYTGDAFFTVGETTYADGVYTIVLTPVGENTVIKLNNVSSDKSEDGVAYYQEYVRINNNNTAVADYITIDKNEDNTYTLTFNYAAYKADNPPAAE